MRAPPGVGYRRGVVRPAGRIGGCHREHSPAARLQDLASLEAAARAFPAAIVKFALLAYVFAWLIWALRAAGRPRLALAAAISAIVLMAPIALSIFR